MDFDGIAGNLIASAIWLVLGIGGAATYQYSFRARKLRRIWRQPRKSKAVNLVAASLMPEQTGEYARPSTGLGELRASALVQESLLQAYPRRKANVHVDLSSLVTGQQLQGPLVVIGGPRHNSLTRTLMSKFRLDYYVDLSAPISVCDKHSGIRYTPNLSDDPIIDYGVIYRLPNIYARQHPVIVLAGSHTYGVTGAARMLTAEYVDDLHQATSKLGVNWQAIVRTECLGGVEFPSIVSARRVEPSDVRPAQ